MKAEASGFPYNCTTKKQKQDFILDFYKKNNVILRMDQIKYNASKRSLAKLMMNSLFGKREHSVNYTI